MLRSYIPVHTVNNLASTLGIVVIGLFDLPLEIKLQITEFVEASQALKALSVTSRSPCRILQSMLFTSHLIDLGKELKGSLDDLFANPWICAAICFLELRGWCLLSKHPLHSDEEKLSVIK